MNQAVSHLDFLLEMIYQRTIMFTTFIKGLIKFECTFFVKGFMYLLLTMILTTYMKTVSRF
jgi:hypothetical protein